MKVAIVGIGSISKNHIHALQKAEQQIVALCDVELSRCEAAKERFGLDCPVFSDYIQMLDAVKPEAVHICTPHYLHAPMCCEALSRNIHVLCEKPLAISHEQLAQIGAAVSASSATLGVSHQNRYLAASRLVKEFIADHPITAATAVMHWKRDASYYASGAWRGKWETEGGGVMINQALHTLDLLQWFCGYPKTLRATISNESLQGVIEVEDTAFGIFTVDEGKNFMIHATNAATGNFPVQIMLRCDKDTVELCRNNVVINGELHVTDDGVSTVGKAEWGVGHILLVQDFYDCIATGRKFPLDFEEASKVIRLILGMYASNGEEKNA